MSNRFTIEEKLVILKILKQIIIKWEKSVHFIIYDEIQ